MWVSVKHRFLPRKTEWIFGWILMIAGLVLLHPYETFDLPSYILFKSLMTENVWGFVMAGVGGARLMGLWINGSMRNVTPWIRAASAGFSFFVWLGISLAFFFSGVIGWWIAIFPTFVVVEVMNVHHAMKDTGEAYAASRSAL